MLHPNDRHFHSGNNLLYGCGECRGMQLLRPAQGREKAGPSAIFGVHVKLIRRNVVPTLALAKSPTAFSNEMAWLGAGLLIAAVVMTIWMVLHG